MAVKIDKKIVGFSVSTKDKGNTEEADSRTQEGNNVVLMHEDFERPETLQGSTIKLKNPTIDHALYVTVNHIVLNEGTEHETVRPFEVFINTKDPNSQPWIVALTRMISATWRKGGDFMFVVDELKAVADPKGGFFLPGGVFVQSAVAHIGLALEQHLEYIGATHPEDLSPEVRALVEAKRKEYLDKLAAPAQTAPKGRGKTKAKAEETEATGDAVPGASMCGKCNNNAVVVMDGCSTCLSCGDGNCG